MTIHGVSQGQWCDAQTVAIIRGAPFQGQVQMVNCFHNIVHVIDNSTEKPKGTRGFIIPCCMENGIQKNLHLQLKIASPQSSHT
jgi:hypothetical protein